MAVRTAASISVESSQSSLPEAGTGAARGAAIIASDRNVPAGQLTGVTSRRGSARREWEFWSTAKAGTEEVPSCEFQAGPELAEWGGLPARAGHPPPEAGERHAPDGRPDPGAVAGSADRPSRPRR